MGVALFAKRRCVFALALPLLISPAIAQVQVNQTFIPQGPTQSFGPSEIVQSRDDPPNGTASGAVQAILLDPLLGPETIFIGSPNGGVWKTTDGGTSWAPLTDDLASLSIASLGLDTTDLTGNTLIAGIGITSSGVFDYFNRRNGDGSGGLQTGLIYSTDGGENWTPMGGSELAGQSVIGVAARGTTIMAATFEEGDPTKTQTSDGALYGLYLSTDGGQSFNLVPQCSQPCSGLPAGPVTALTADPDPTHSGTFYAAVTSPTTKDLAGVYVTHDFGASWSPVFTADTTPAGGTNVITGTTEQLVIRLATGPDGSVAIAVAGGSIEHNGDAKLKGLYLSQDGGGSWSALATPPTNPANGALYKLAVAIDPADTSIVYVAGDSIDGDNQQTIKVYTSPTFRVQGNTFTPLSYNYSANDSAVHADTRALVVDPLTGNLMLVGDGGVYFRTDPQSDNGAWTGLNSTLQVREGYEVGYGANAHRLVVAAQDSGVMIQSAPDSPVYNGVQGADGYIALARDVDDPTFGPVSVYYTAWDWVGSLSRLVLDSEGNPVSPGTNPAGVQVNCKLEHSSPTDCATATTDPSNTQGRTADVVLNEADPTRIAIAGLPDVYITQDTAPLDASEVRLELTSIGKATPELGAGALAYGTPNDPDVLLAGNAYGEILSTNLVRGELYLWTPDLGSLTRLSAYGACDSSDAHCQERPASEREGRVPTSVVFGQSAQDFYVADSFNLWGTHDQGSSIAKLTENLAALDITRPTSVEFIDNNGVSALLTGGLMDCPTGFCSDLQSPIAIADSNNGDLINWRPFGSSLPNALVYQMSYYSAPDVLAISTIGRGVWTLYDVTSYFAQADVLKFGLADNDSRPDASYLTDGTSLSENDFVRHLDKYGTGLLTIAGAASYTGDTTIFDGKLQLGDGGRSGSILGDVEFCDDGSDPQCAAGIDKLLIFNRADNYTFEGTISGHGQVVQKGTGSTVLTADNTYTGPTKVEKGTLIVNGAIKSDVSVELDGTLSGIGSVGSVDVVGVISPGDKPGPGHGIGTLHIDGHANLKDATYQVNANAAGDADRLVVRDAVTLDNTILEILAEGGDYASSTSYLVIDKTGAGAIAGSFSKITSNSIFVSPSVVYDGGNGNDAVLTLDAVAYETFADTRNQRAVANALDDGPFGPLAASIFYLDEANAREAFTQLAGEVHPTTLGILAEDSRYVRQAVLGRTVQAQYQDLGSDVAISAAGGVPTPEDVPEASPVGFWAQAFGAWADYDGDGNAAGGKRDLGGFVTGLDVGLDSAWRLGAAAGYSQSSIRLDRQAGSADVDSYALAAYGGGELGPVALRLGAAWSWHDIDTARSVNYPGVFEQENASYDGDTGQIFGELAYPIISGDMAIEPFAGLAYVHVKTDGFQEDGGMAALNGESADQDVGFSTLGLRWAGTIAMGETALMPRASLAWQHGFDQLTPETALIFTGTDIGFTATGLPIVRDSALIDVGLAFELAPGITLGASYMGQFADDLQDNAVQGRLGWSF